MIPSLKKIGPATVFLSIYCFPVIFFIINTILSSFKTKTGLAQSFFGITREFTLENYKEVLIEDSFLRYFGNSIFLTAISLTALIVVSSMLAYGISWYQFRFKSLLEIFFLLGMMFPIQLGILPNFVTLRTMGLLNRFGGLILLYTANLSLACFIFSKFFKTLPKELYESARIDGSGEFRIFFSIMLPLCKPVIGTVALVSGINIWNDFYMPMVFLTKEENRTLTLGIYRYMANFMANYHKIFPAVAVVLVPVVLLFIFTSKQMVDGITRGAIKQ